MNVRELIEVLGQLPADTEVRLGDQLEEGPYFHDRVGSIWTDRPNNAGDIRYVMICAEDTDWRAETDSGKLMEGDELPIIWTAPAPIPGEMEGE
jgi:hypothetical protein